MLGSALLPTHIIRGALPSAACVQGTFLHDASVRRKFASHQADQSKSRRAPIRRRAARLLALCFMVAAVTSTSSVLRAQEFPQDPCPRPAPGSAVPEPEDLRSENGVLKVDLAVRNFKTADGSTKYCYLLADGNQSPTLRLSPGDLLILNLKNDLTASESAPVAPAPGTH